MPYSIAKLFLEKARTDREREIAIETALALGMPLHAIEEYLDWLDASRSSDEDHSESPSDA